MPPAAIRLLNLQQVGEMLCLSASSLRRAIRDGRLPVHRLGRAIRVSEADLVQFLGRSRRVSRN
jgi:excisionase family DNA binding protein